ncbi:hypothetical protein L209DRAFT_250664 [Thermothelomyces heterothallicus CBS 203.75]
MGSVIERIELRRFQRLFLRIPQPKRRTGAFDVCRRKYHPENAPGAHRDRGDREMWMASWWAICPAAACGVPCFHVVDAAHGAACQGFATATGHQDQPYGIGQSGPLCLPWSVLTRVDVAIWVQGSLVLGCEVRVAGRGK